MKKKVVVLGATGSIGQSTLQVIEKFSSQFQILAITAHCQGDQLIELAEKYSVPEIILTDEQRGREFKHKIPPALKFSYGQSAVLEVVQRKEVNIVVNGIVGSAGYFPTKHSLLAGKRVALANKETMVAYGEIINEIIEKGSGEIIPVDSEHGAIWQLLRNRNPQEVENLILTASGGALRDHPHPHGASLEEVLKHPTWNMGKKITVDSATLANKGLEVIEASRLFKISWKKIKVLIHPTSIVHSMVELVDGSILAQLAEPDMKLPIQYSLSYPQRLPGTIPLLDLVTRGPLEFRHPDHKRFPALKLAYRALEQGGSYPCVYNAANEQAVEMFIQGKIGFMDISAIIEKTMDNHENGSGKDELFLQSADGWARNLAKEIARSR
ncbi:MAG: hypothetical protein APR63_10105 [Desulfuromonas sp. SDB]|nr:MAG: hypothetical protein APR63_10105 [Desulfuromonas sp. SDB]